MNNKERIVELLQDAGYDFFTACEEYERIIADFRQSSADQVTYALTDYVNNRHYEVTLKRAIEIA